jgi:TPP-dependent trihydroxycyclohexane-1,2-dione (THcHDO) dehydratase
VQSDLDELLNEAKNSEEKAKKAMVDAARLADELRAEQDHAQTQEKLRKALETQIKELQVLIYVPTQSLQTNTSQRPLPSIFIPAPDE